jgi:hypothetical protein
MHHAVQPAMPGGNSIDGSRDLVFVGDIGRLISDRATARLYVLDLLDCGRQSVGIPADDHDRGPGGYQPGGHPLANPTATAGDQVRPVFERKLHASPFTPKLKQVLAIEPCADRHKIKR